MSTPSTVGPKPHRDLIALPATLPNIDAKLNHLITRTEVGILSSERAEKTAEKARLLSEQARDAARAAGTHALRANHHAGLPPRQRLLAVAAGAIVGGAAMSLGIQIVLVLTGTAALSSCLGR